MVLSILVRRLWFEALDEIRFPDGKAANALRGGFGQALRALASPEDYERVFEPKQEAGNGPSGFADPPRPFIFRAAHLDGVTTAPRDEFHFDLHVFGSLQSSVTLLTEALEAMWRKGAGVGRGRARMVAGADKVVDVSLAPTGETASRIRIHFRTPTELKHQGRVVGQPEFPILVRRIRDRVSTLMALYGSGAAGLPYEDFGNAAESIRMVRSNVELVEVSRISGRTRQTHTIGGMVGSADYEGEITGYLQCLRAAGHTGVGRHTVWGNGHLEVEILSH